MYNYMRHVVRSEKRYTIVYMPKHTTDRKDKINIRKFLECAIEHEKPVILSMAETVMVDSEIIGLLMGTQKTLENGNKKARLNICSTNERLDNLFTKMRVYEKIPYYDDLGSFVDSL